MKDTVKCRKALLEKTIALMGGSGAGEHPMNIRNLGHICPERHHMHSKMCYNKIQECAI